MTSTRDILERINNLEKAKAIPASQLPDLRTEIAPSLTVSDFDATLYPNSWTNFHFDIDNEQHVQRWELYRNTIAIYELHGPVSDHLGDTNYHAMDFISPETESKFWSTVAELHQSTELQRAVDMLPALQSDTTRQPCVPYIASLVIHPQGWYLFSRLLTVPGLLAHFCYRWGVRMGSMCHNCSSTYRTYVNGNLEHTLAPHAECVVFQPPPGGHELARSACSNCIRSNPDQKCEWSYFPQARKRHEREGSDSLAFAGKSWNPDDKDASHFSMGRLNSIDCTPICRIHMRPIVFDEDGRALYIADPELVES